FRNDDLEMPVAIQISQRGMGADRAQHVGVNQHRPPGPDAPILVEDVQVEWVEIQAEARVGDPGDHDDLVRPITIEIADGVTLEEGSIIHHGERTPWSWGLRAERRAR